MSLYREIERHFYKMERLFTPGELLGFECTPVGWLSEYNLTVGARIRGEMLTGGSRLYRLFLSEKVKKPDDMSAIMILLFHCYIHMSPPCLR